MKPDRLEAIRQHLYSCGTSTVDALAAATGASVATVRRDLVVLEQQGVVSRTHGGARLASGAHVEVEFTTRERHRLAEKRAIGAAAYALLRPQTSVFLDAGTTVLQLAHRLRASPIPSAPKLSAVIADSTVSALVRTEILREASDQSSRVPMAPPI